MIAPPVPPLEAERLAALDSYAILDTGQDARFDAIAAIAAAAMGVPIALVSFVDVDRQWFKARYGLDVPATSRDISFCGHVVSGGDTMIVADTRDDVRFSDNPLVSGAPHIRFYAGVPLTTKDGHILGTLCAIDRTPRQVTPQQLDALRKLAGQVMALLELSQLAREADDQRRRLMVATAELADRERRLTTLFDGMVEGVVLQDSAGAIQHHNAAAELILGLSGDQLTGRTSMDPRWRAIRADGQPFPGTEHPAIVTLRTGAPQSDVEMGVHLPSGHLRWLSINARPLVEPGAQLPYAVITTFRDITMQRAVAERLARHERLVTTGTLAAGVGHEINNPLSYVLTNLELAIEELRAIGGGSPSSRIVEIIAYLGDAVDGAERVKRIVRGLKSLVRDDAEIAPTDLRGVVRVALDLAAHDLRTRASVIDDVGPVPLVVANESRLTQVLVNLLVNAGQAFATDAPSVNRVSIRSAVEGDRVVIEVEDNGPGIPPEVLARIFDPFFTTKAPGIGTGLGLSISHGIVSSFGGELTCETQVGVGSVFRVALPFAPVPVEAPTVRSPRAGQIIIIDDDLKLLKATTRALEREFEVVAVSDPREALRRFAEGERFDVVFCDLTMPHVSGLELFREVARIAPSQAARFVFVSGDLGREDIARFLDEIANERLEKPVSFHTLRAIAKRMVAPTTEAAAAVGAARDSA